MMTNMDRNVTPNIITMGGLVFCYLELTLAPQLYITHRVVAKPERTSLTETSTINVQK